MTAPSLSEAHQRMMTEGQAVAVQVLSLTGKASPGEVRLKIWDRKERMRRAMRFWGLCWGLGLFSVILPLVHFVLVPAFLIAGPVGAWILFGQQSAILGGEARCPDCDAFLPIARAADEWPLSDLCSSCQRRVRIEKA